ncbi:hypothetical protein Sste5346_008334 [Sporothrix stenoceras]|uniref:Uncharacterized protein n=1 Tax=Sporothrix stenoceras TaxID=5173 RepID=A0ABR3YR21_9PEZI
MHSFTTFALALLPALATAGFVRRSNCDSTPPVMFNLALYNPTTNAPTGQYLDKSGDPYNVNTNPDGSPTYIGYAGSSLPSSPMFQLDSTTGSWQLAGGGAYASQLTGTFDMVSFADTAYSAGLPPLTCSFDDGTGKFSCTTPSLPGGGVFGLCGQNVVFWDGISSTGCPGPVIRCDLYKV